MLKDRTQSPSVVCGVHKALIWQGKGWAPLFFSFILLSTVQHEGCRQAYSGQNFED